MEVFYINIEYKRLHISYTDTLATHGAIQIYFDWLIDWLIDWLNYPTTELSYSKLKYGYLAELLVVMTDRIKIVRILARNVPRRPIRGHKRLEDDVFLVSLSLQESDGVVFSKRWGTVLLKHKKIISGQPAHAWEWLLRKKVVATICPLHSDTKSEQSDCNKSGVSSPIYYIWC